MPSRNRKLLYTLIGIGLLISGLVAYAFVVPTPKDPFRFLPEDSPVYAGPTPEIELANSGRRYRVYSWRADFATVEEAMKRELPRHGIRYDEMGGAWIRRSGHDYVMVSAERDKRPMPRPRGEFVNTEEALGWVTVYVHDTQPLTLRERIQALIGG